MKFELKESTNEDKRLIIYTKDSSTGYVASRQELYNLYGILREEFKDA